MLHDKRFEINGEIGAMFQHDQAAAHMATATYNLLDEHEVNVIEWPPKGADLSPIEPCFGEIQRLIRLQYSEINN